MERILEARQEMADKVNEQKELVNKAEEEKRDLTSKENLKFKKLDKDINKLEGEVKKLEKQDEKNKANIVAESNTKKNSLVAKDRTYRGMFYEGKKEVNLRNNNFDSLNEFLRVVKSGRYDERLSMTRDSMNESIPSEGGFVVPEIYGKEIWDASLEKEIIRPRATVWPMESNKRKVPATDGLDRSGNTVYGGLDVEWLNEGSTATKQIFKLGSIEMIAEKGAIYIDASNELLEDGLNFENQLRTIVQKALTFGLDKAFINGDGAGKPLGILNSDCLIGIDREEGGKINAEDIVNMYSRLFKDDLENCVWIVNNDCMADILSLSMAIGTGGSAVYFSNFQEKAPMSLMGLPVVYSEKNPAAGDKGDIILANLKHYAVGMRKYMRFDKSQAPGWTEDETSFRMIVRINGQPTFSEAITPTNGTNSLSPLVTLNA